MQPHYPTVPTFRVAAVRGSGYETNTAADVDYIIARVGCFGVTITLGFKIIELRYFQFMVDSKLINKHRRQFIHYFIEEHIVRAYTLVYTISVTHINFLINFDSY